MKRLKSPLKMKDAEYRLKCAKKFSISFFRASEGDIHTTAGGPGLGLAIARGIVESQDGRIWIEDGRDGFVARVAFQIPVGDE